MLLGSTIGLIYRSFRYVQTCSHFCSVSRFSVEEVIYCIAVWKWRTAIDFRRMLIWQSRGWWTSALCRMWHQCLSKRCVCHMKRMSSMRGIVENSLPLGFFKDFLLPWVWSTATTQQILWSSGFLLLGQVAKVPIKVKGMSNECVCRSVVAAAFWGFDVCRRRGRAGHGPKCSIEGSRRFWKCCLAQQLV